MFRDYALALGERRDLIAVLPLCLHAAVARELMPRHHDSKGWAQSHKPKPQPRGLFVARLGWLHGTKPRAAGYSGGYMAT